MRFDIHDRWTDSFGGADDGLGVGIEKLVVSGEVLDKGSRYGRWTV